MTCKLQVSKIDLLEQPSFGWACLLGVFPLFLPKASSDAKMRNNEIAMRFGVSPYHVSEPTLQRVPWELKL